MMRSDKTAMSSNAKKLAPGEWLVGVEIGGTKLQLGLGRDTGDLKAIRRVGVDPAGGARGILEQIAFELDQLIHGANLDFAAVAAVGVGFGGPVDRLGGTVRNSYQIEGWTQFDLRSWFQGRFHGRRGQPPPVVLLNDADAAALGEARWGRGKGCSPLVYVTVGSGVGGGLVIDGALCPGSIQGPGAMELGHLRIARANNQELEAVASGWALASRAKARWHEAGASTLRDLVDGDVESVTGEIVGIAAGLGDPVCREVVEQAVDAMVEALTAVVVLIGPQRIILGGGVSLMEEDLWIKPIEQGLRREVPAMFRDTIDLVRPKLGDHVVLHGAIAAAHDVWEQVASSYRT